MRTLRRHVGREVFRATGVVTVALLGLFSFFTLVDRLDRVNDELHLSHLLYLELLDLPTRLYDLLPIGLLIGAILALAGLAQRHELVILRVSGISALGLLRLLWRVALPLVVAALLLAEYVVPATETRLSEANLTLLGRSGGGRMASGYWFRERLPDGSRILNVSQLRGNGELSDITLYNFDADQELTLLARAERGYFEDGQLVLQGVGGSALASGTADTLADARPTAVQPVRKVVEPELRLDSSLTPALLLSRVLTPERMSFQNLQRYITYLEDNQLVSDRQRIALWRKAIYPITLLIMLAIAAPIGLMQTRRGGVSAKMFAGILAGVMFFMTNQLALNAGMLYGWPPILTALGPSVIALALSLTAMLLLEHRNRLSAVWARWWPWHREARRARA